MEHKRKIFGALAAAAGVGLHALGFPITQHPQNAAILGFIAPTAIFAVSGLLKEISQEWQNYKNGKKIQNDITALATAVEKSPTTGAEQLNSFLALTESAGESLTKNASDAHVAIALRLYVLGNGIVSRMPSELTELAKKAIDTNVNLLCDKLGVCFREDAHRVNNAPGKKPWTDLALDAPEGYIRPSL